MNSTVTSILTFLEGSKQFVIPIYQRTYEWKKEQCVEFWEDVLNIGGTSEPKSHFFGSIVYMDPEEPQNIGDVREIFVIDGQQRLTTLSLLILALSRVLQEQGIDIGISSEELSNLYLFNNNKVGESRYKQILTKSDKETLICLFEDRELPTPLSPRLESCYQYFYSQCKKVNLEVVYRGIQRLQIVSIVLEPSQDNPQVIFETLNAKGLELSQTDKIRNYLLMGQTEKSQTRLYNDLWFPIEQRFRNEEKQFDRFMRHYLTLKTRSIPRVRDIYKKFKSHVELSELAVEDIIKEVSRYSKYYLNIALLQEKDKELKACLKSLHELKADTAYPFLLKVYDCYIEGKIKKWEVIRTLRLVESYIFRRAVCGSSNKFLNHIFVDILSEMDTTDENNYLENLNETFLGLLDHRRYPRDREFRLFFSAKDMSNFSSRDYLLRKMENDKRKEPISFNEYTVEHIMPQTLNDQWKQDLGENFLQIHDACVNNIGNLTLTGRNSEFGNRSFKEKRDMLEEGFRYSSLYLNQSLALAKKWDQTTIKARANELARKACEIWVYPE